MTPSAALALSLLTLAVPAPPPAPPFDGLGAPPAPPPPVELVDADGKVFGALVSFGAQGGMGPGAILFAAAGGRLFALSHNRPMTPEGYGPAETRYDNSAPLVWASADCTGTAYAQPPMMGDAFPEGFVAKVAELQDGWRVVRVSPATVTLTQGSYKDWFGACYSFGGEWPWIANVLEDLGPAPAFKSPLRPRVNVP